MEKYIALNNDNFDGINFQRSKISGEKRACVVFMQPLFKLIFSVFRSSWFAVKVIVLSAISLTYFVIGAIAVSLYLIIYEKLFKTLLMSLERRRPKSPYYYKWKNHHLELNYEM